MDNEENKNKEQPKKIPVVSGNGNDLDISKVYNHLNIDDNSEKPEQGPVIIPNEKK